MSKLSKILKASQLVAFAIGTLEQDTESKSAGEMSKTLREVSGALSEVSSLIKAEQKPQSRPKATFKVSKSPTRPRIKTKRSLQP